MFDAETRKELAAIIADGVFQGLKLNQAENPLAGKADVPEKVDALAEDKGSPAEKKVPKARKKPTAKKAKKVVEEVAAKPEEVEDAFEDDLEDDEAEAIEVPPMSRPDFMATLKRYASKHPNGEKEGRKLASTVLKRDYDVDKFGELEDKYFSLMCDSLKNEIKSI